MEESERPSRAPILPNKDSYDEIEGKNSNNNFINFRMAGTAIVPKGTTNEYSVFRTQSYSPKQKNLLLNPESQKHPLV